MKRNIVLTVLSMVLFFASCKNDNLDVQRKVNFEVNPHEVISGFTYEMGEGELESFNSSYKLQIHLLIYDEMGYLKASDVDYLPNYQGILKSSLVLEDGEYTAVAITDVVKYDGGVISNYWNITETHRLSDLKVSDVGNKDGKYKILGISNYHFNVGEGSADHIIRVKPAGALILVRSLNIHYYNTVEMYKLGMNKSSDCCTFNSDGSYAVTVENGGDNYEWHLGCFEPQEYVGFNEYYYYDFVLPHGKTNFQWLGKTNENTWHYAGDKMTANISSGQEYLVRFELGSDIKVQMDIVNGGKVTE